MIPKMAVKTRKIRMLIYGSINIYKNFKGVSTYGKRHEKPKISVDGQ